ncbi:hypothetical protein D9M71_759250 [compost metagenome]
MGGAVFVEAHFAGERQAAADVLRFCLGQLNAGSTDLLRTQFDVSLFGMVSRCTLFGVIGMLRSLVGMRVDACVT